MDLSRLSEDQLFLLKKGCFEIDRRRIIDKPFLVMRILSMVLVVEAHQVNDNIIYQGYCDRFDVVKEGEIVPVYMVHILDAGGEDIVFTKENNARLREVMDEASLLRSYIEEGRERIDRVGGVQDVSFREPQNSLRIARSLLYQPIISNSQFAHIVSA